MKRLFAFGLLASFLTLAFTTANHIPGCNHVQGRIVDPGRMIGTISGRYVYVGDNYQEWDPDDTEVVFNSGNSFVEGSKGTITFQEYAALDFSEYVGTNGAVLMVVTGGTGRWEGATGHIILSGYFHLDTFQGEWKYQGEVCVP
jgi:hypothetical protein